MLQAITTKHLGPTNTRGGRVRAFASAGSITVNWDHALNVAQNHCAAARALAKRLDWQGRYVGGATDTGYVFVFPIHPANARDGEDNFWA
jgi:hypothetical protein